MIGTLRGVLIGFLLSFYSESKRREHQQEKEYRSELKKHVDDLIKPLFVSIQNLWGSIAALDLFLKKGVEVESLTSMARKVQSDNRALYDFVGSKYDEISFLFPSPFPWIFTPIYEFINNRIVEPISKGEKPIKDITIAVNKLMAIQENLRRLLGFEVEVKMEKVYPLHETQQ